MTSPRRSDQSAPAAEPGALQPPTAQGACAPALSVEQGHAHVDREEAEFAKLVAKLRPHIRARALPRLRSAGLEYWLDDVVEQVLSKLRELNVIERLEGDPVRILNYALKATENQVTDVLRSEAGRNRMLAGCARCAARWFGVARMPDEEMMQRELETLIVQTEDKMTPRRREIFDRRFWEGMSYDEIAESLGTSSKTVSAHYTEAMSLVRETVADGGYYSGFSNRGKRKERNS